MLTAGRFYLALRMYWVTLIFFNVTRLVLGYVSLSSESYGVLDLLNIFGIGWLYDSLYYLYAMLPVSLYLWLLPERLWRSRLNISLLYLLVFGTLYGLGFIAVSEYLFWDEFSVRFNFISVDYLVYRREVTDNIVESYPLPALLSAIFIVALLAFLWVRPVIHKVVAIQQPWKQRFGFALANYMVAILAMLGISQGLARSDSTYVRELASNGPYQFFAAFRNNELDYSQFYAQLDPDKAAIILRELVNEPQASFETEAGFDIKRQIHARGEEKRLNIILIMVESLSAKYLGIFGNKEGLTPNLDRLSQQSLLFTRMYATGTRTTRGLEAVTLSIPPTPGRSIVKRIGREGHLWSLGNVLNEKGYDSYFIYGGRGYFDNMNAFFSKNGYQIIDQNSVPEEEKVFENAWGMADEYLFDQAIKAADQSQASGKPFFFHLMTTSNHRPYTYPEDRIDIPSHSGRRGAVKYTDWAIGDFIKKAQRHDWFDHTLFVVIADHTAGSAGRTELPVFRYHIPMLVYAPNMIQPGKVETLASQIDVAPTLLGLMNMSYRSAFFGKNLLNSDASEGRSLIANYQHLGYYTPGKLSILSPKSELRQFSNPESEDTRKPVEPIDTRHMQAAQAFYQGADIIYHQGLNRWESDE